jgi:hypothetical protein
VVSPYEERRDVLAYLKELIGQLNNCKAVEENLHYTKLVTINHV